MATNNAVDVTLSGQTGTGSFGGSVSPNLTTPTISGSNGLTVATFADVASSIYNFTFTSAASGNSPVMSVAGAVSAGMDIFTPGGRCRIGTSSSNITGFSVYNGTWELVFNTAALTATRQLIFPNGAVTFTAGTTVVQGGVLGTPSSGTLTNCIGALVYLTVAGTTQAAVVNNGYVISNASQTTVTLPATAALGSVVAVQGAGAGGWILTANTGQTIQLGSSATSSAGSLTSTNQWDTVTVVCVVANTTWAVRSVVGNITVS